MDQHSQKLFDELMAKQPHELRESDIEFLKARQSYLTPDQLEVFGTALGLTPEEAPKKKSK